MKPSHSCEADSGHLCDNYFKEALRDLELKNIREVQDNNDVEEMVGSNLTFLIY